MLTFSVLGMSGTLTGLYFAHRKQRDLERSKRAQYWREQVSTAIVLGEDRY